MIRRQIFDHHGLEDGMQDGMQARSREVGRLEALSDGVFGLSIALLVVSSQVPSTFAELWAFMGEFPAFFLCMVMIAMIWRMHHRFFLQFALCDRYIVRVNTLLLFLILFYSFPLKFLFSFCLRWFYLIGADIVTRDPLLGKEFDMLFSQTILPSQLPSLLTIYSAGLGLIFMCFALFYGHAHRRKEELAMNPLEILHTRSSRDLMWAYVGVTALSLLVSVTGYLVNFPFAGTLAGGVYLLMYFVGRGFRAKLNRQKAQLESQPAINETVTTETVSLENS